MSDIVIVDQRLHNTVHARLAGVRLLSAYQPANQPDQGSA
jgi:hypothetical protein